MIARRLFAVVLFALATITFQLFNYDTTKYALADLINPAYAGGLAVAFCAADVVWVMVSTVPASTGRRLLFLWSVAALANTGLTWHAVRLTLVNYNFGSEVLTYNQMLLGVPIFVAGLVLITRTLFCGAVGVSVYELLPTPPQTKTPTVSRRR